MNTGSITETPETMLFRSVCAQRIADLLMQAVTVDATATMQNQPAHRDRVHYWELSEGLVSLVCDRPLLIAPDYFAADSICHAHGKTIEHLSLADRYAIVQDWRLGLSAWLRIFREGTAGLLTKYRLIGESDLVKFKAERDDAAKRLRAQMRRIPE